MGEIATSSSELLVVFKSDCEVTNKGFQAIVEFDERIVPTTTSIYVPTIEDTTNIQTSTTTYVPTTEQTAVIPTTSTSSYVSTTEGSASTLEAIVYTESNLNVMF